jgi:hypothetical protein
LAAARRVHGLAVTDPPASPLEDALAAAYAAALGLPPDAPAVRTRARLAAALCEPEAAALLAHGHGALHLHVAQGRYQRAEVTLRGRAA